MKRLSIVLLTLFLGTQALGQSFIAKAYCRVLGNNDVRQEYADLVHQALRDFDVNNAELVYVKKANSVGSVLALMPVSSFTACGIWLDEDYLDQCSSSEVLFQIYHEAAHYAQHHHAKLLATALGITGVIASGFAYGNKILREKNYSHPLVTTAAAGTLLLAAAYVGILPNIVKRQERRADIEAAKKLYAIGREDVVAVHKQNLRRNSSEAGNLWWFSSKEQADYLDDVIGKS